MDTILCRGDLRDLIQGERDGTAAVRAFIHLQPTKNGTLNLSSPLAIFERYDGTNFNTASHPERDSH
jgi:hypothetical protein